MRRPLIRLPARERDLGATSRALGRAPGGSGGFGGEVKAGGMGAAPRDRELMSRSCAELVASELLANLPQRKP